MYNPYGKPRRLVVPQVLETGVASFKQDDHPALSRNLLRDLQTEKAKLVEELILAKDWADYEKRRGLINGVQTAINLCENAQSKLNA